MIYIFGFIIGMLLVPFIDKVNADFDKEWTTEEELSYNRIRSKPTSIDAKGNVYVDVGGVKYYYKDGKFSHET